MILFLEKILVFLLKEGLTGMIWRFSVILMSPSFQKRYLLFPFLNQEPYDILLKMSLIFLLLLASSEEEEVRIRTHVYIYIYIYIYVYICMYTYVYIHL